jgi:hypothetical protein
MPLLSTFPHFPSLSFLPNTRLLYSPTPRSRLSLGASKITVTVTESHQSEPNNGASSILWFKHDLRVDDHPGLVAASKSRALVPLYVFDHRILSREFHIHQHSFIVHFCMYVLCIYEVYMYACIRVYLIHVCMDVYTHICVCFFV